MPKISVIIPTYNDDAEILVKTIDSVLNQKNINMELIVVDGGKAIINRKNIKVVRSKPKGIANAFNIGIHEASGDYLYFMGAGDYFNGENVLCEMMESVNKDKDMLVVGRINRVSKNAEILYTTKNNFKKWQLLYKMAIPHQGLFTNKKFFEKYGLFDEKCKYAMDYELLLRAYKNFPEVVQKNIVVANWEEGGVGQNDTDKVIAEYHRIRVKNRIVSRWVLETIYGLTKWRYGYK